MSPHRKSQAELPAPPEVLTNPDDLLTALEHTLVELRNFTRHLREEIHTERGLDG